MTNWFVEPGRNPFNLLPPPASFLRELAAFDADLVIFPSAQTFGYWITRRRKASAGITTVMDNGKDSGVMARHGLIPVTVFGGSVTWGAQVLQWFKDRDTWAVGGWKNAADIYEEQDKDADKAYLRWREGENDARGRSMYRTYKRRNGESVALSDVHRGQGQIRSKRRVPTTPRVGIGSAPVPPTSAMPVTPSGWQESSSGLVTPPTH